MEQKCYNFKTHFTEAYFELNEFKLLNKKHDGFVADKTTNRTHVEEANMADSLNNLTNYTPSGATNITNLTAAKAKLAEK